LIPLVLRTINRKLTKYLEDKYPNWDVSVALRYLPIVDDIKNYLEPDTEVLDVGSGEFGLATYARGKFNITGTDIAFRQSRKQDLKIVKASAEKLPFKDNFFDAVVSVDMMEHLRPEIRKKAVSEMIRVAKHKVYLSFPTGNLSRRIDGAILRYYKFTHKEELPFLREHLQMGLPHTKDIESFIKDSFKQNNKTGQIVKKGNTNSLVWLILLLLGFSEVNLLTSFYHKLLFFLPILKLVHFWPTYRIMYIVGLDAHD